jgi:hypothetical protein
MEAGDVSVSQQLCWTLFEKLLEKPGMYQGKMSVFLYDEFDVLVNTSAVSRALASIGWMKKATRQITKERNADLRDYYLHRLSDFEPHHLVYVYKSGCDKRISFRRTGLSPLGVASIPVAQFHQCLLPTPPRLPVPTLYCL